MGGRLVCVARLWKNTGVLVGCWQISRSMSRSGVAFMLCDELLRYYPQKCSNLSVSNLLAQCVLKIGTGRSNNESASY